MKKLFFALITTLVVFAHVQVSEAHVLMMDDTNTIGGVLHINPDDDPVAGESAHLFLDPQIDKRTVDSMQLTVRDTNGDEVAVDRSFNYVFPTQGVYELVFAVNSAGSNYIFTHTQLVTRGVTTGALDSPSHAWAEITLLMSGIGITLLVVIGFNFRKEIARQSTF